MIGPGQAPNLVKTIPKPLLKWSKLVPVVSHAGMDLCTKFCVDRIWTGKISSKNLKKGQVTCNVQTQL